VDFLYSALQWLADNAGLTTSLLVLSVVLLVGSIWLGHYYLTTIPPDYFVRPHIPFEKLRCRRPALWWALMIAKNLLGVVLMLIGLIMFVTPGQGLLTLMMGLALTNFPGKQRLERTILKQPLVCDAVNRMRARANRAPLVLSSVD
jgi:hypothetical protein